MAMEMAATARWSAMPIERASMDRASLKRIFVTLAATGAIALAIGGAFAWNKYLRMPSPESLPMPAHLIALDSSAGQKLLARADAADFDALVANFTPQTRRAYCGVAS